jgi:hypothetical protein
VNKYQIVLIHLQHRVPAARRLLDGARLEYAKQKGAFIKVAKRNSVSRTAKWVVNKNAFL